MSRKYLRSVSEVSTLRDEVEFVRVDLREGGGVGEVGRHQHLKEAAEGGRVGRGGRGWGRPEGLSRNGTHRAVRSLVRCDLVRSRAMPSIAPCDTYVQMDLHMYRWIFIDYVDALPSIAPCERILLVSARVSTPYSAGMPACDLV